MLVPDIRYLKISINAILPLNANTRQLIVERQVLRLMMSGGWKWSPLDERRPGDLENRDKRCRTEVGQLQHGAPAIACCTEGHGAQGKRRDEQDADCSPRSRDEMLCKEQVCHGTEYAKEAHDDRDQVTLS